jgi:hypothetical protein
MTIQRTIGRLVAMLLGTIALTTGGPAGCATSEQAATRTLRGAAYATSEVVIEPAILVSWDRGWNAAGEQVWGATKGGYEFVKRGPGPPPPP